jgi:hypothetical protein
MELIVLKDTEQSVFQDVFGEREFNIYWGK